MIRYCIVTISDKGAAGLRKDKSGPAIEGILSTLDAELVEYTMIPDERSVISEVLIRMCEQNTDLIITTGGTGLSPRDVTPEATLDVVERQVPGIPEAMRVKSLELTDRAMLSRAVAGTRGKTLIINLPGSEKAVCECLDVILPVLDHAIQILKGASSECGSSLTGKKVK